MTSWLEIRYREFYDIPRAMVVDWNGDTYLFDCAFDYDEDEYEASYTVYLLPDEVSSQLGETSWTDLGHRGARVGAVPTSAAQFDATRRRQLNVSIFEALRRAESRAPTKPAGQDDAAARLDVNGESFVDLSGPET